MSRVLGVGVEGMCGVMMKLSSGLSVILVVKDRVFGFLCEIL